MVESITDAAFDEYAEIRLTDMLDAACCFKNLRTLWIDSHLSAVAGEREDFAKNISRRKKTDISVHWLQDDDESLGTIAYNIGPANSMPGTLGQNSSQKSSKHL